MVSVLSLLHLCFDSLLKVWEVLLDALRDHLQALFPGLALFLDVALEELLLLPDGVSCALNDVLAGFRDVGETLLQKLLALRDFGPPMAQLLRLVASLSVQEVDNLRQLPIDVLKL